METRLWVASLWICQLVKCNYANFSFILESLLFSSVFQLTELFLVNRTFLTGHSKDDSEQIPWDKYGEIKYGIQNKIKSRSAEWFLRQNCSESLSELKTSNYIRLIKNVPVIVLWQIQIQIFYLSNTCTKRCLQKYSRHIYVANLPPPRYLLKGKI